MKNDALFCKQSGVYAIHNELNGHHYIGSAISIQNRTRDHFSKLKKGIHENSHLQRAFSKYGESSFYVQVIETVGDKTKLTEREQFYLDTMLPHYNILKFARSALGFKHSKEECLRISERVAARYAALNQEEKDAISASFSMRGKSHSDATKELMSRQRLGTKKSESERVKMEDRWKLQGANAQRASVAAKVKRYVVTTPIGIEIEIENLSKFCRENNLSQAHMSSAAQGLRRGNKGWLCRYLDNPIAYDDSRKPRYAVNGKMLTVTEIGVLLGLHKNTVSYHIKKGGIDRILRLLPMP